MKIALTIQGDSLDSQLDRRFGRTSAILIYDLETKTFIVFDNKQNFNSSQGAGIQTAETVARSGAKAIVTGHCGPKAFRVLSAAGIKVYSSDATNAADALQKFIAGELEETVSPDVEGHWI